VITFAARAIQTVGSGVETTRSRPSRFMSHFGSMKEVKAEDGDLGEEMREEGRKGERERKCYREGERETEEVDEREGMIRGRGMGR
jgi:hypothetical protein